MELVLPWLLEKKILHKIVRNLEQLRKHNKKDNSQIGKIITVYFASTEDAVRIAEELDRLLTDHGLTGPAVLGDRAFGNSGLIFYRYAAVKYEEKWDKYTQRMEKKYVMKVPHLNIWVEDPVRKGRLTYKPWWIKDTFEKLKKRQGLNRILTTMKNIRSNI